MTPSLSASSPLKDSLCVSHTHYVHARADSKACESVSIPSKIKACRCLSSACPSGCSKSGSYSSAFNGERCCPAPAPAVPRELSQPNGEWSVHTFRPAAGCRPSAPLFRARERGRARPVFPRGRTHPQERGFGAEEPFFWLRLRLAPLPLDLDSGVFEFSLETSW